MKIEATTTKMLAACCIHITILNMSLMVLKAKAVNANHKTAKKSLKCVNCSVMLQVETTDQQKGLHLLCLPDDWTLEAELQEVLRRAPGTKKLESQSQSQCQIGGRKADEVEVLEGDPAFDQVMIHA